MDEAVRILGHCPVCRHLMAAHDPERHTCGTCDDINGPCRDQDARIQKYRDAIAADLGGVVRRTPFTTPGPPYLCSIEVPVNCPHCGHAVNSHDPEDGTCDVHRDVGLGPCQCPGLRRATLADEITAQGEAAHAEEGAELVATALAAWRRCRAAGFVHDDAPDPEVRELTAALDELAAWELT